DDVHHLAGHDVVAAAGAEGDRPLEVLGRIVVVVAGCAAVGATGGTRGQPGREYGGGRRDEYAVHTSLLGSGRCGIEPVPRSGRESSESIVVVVQTGLEKHDAAARPQEVADADRVPGQRREEP